jgi:DNA repair exonuclease SbcCD nuclease subunit
LNQQTSKSEPFFLATADWHFGKRQYGLLHRERDRYKAAWQIVRYAVEQGAAFILNGGDLLDVTRPGSAAVVELSKIHTFLQEAGIPMYLVQGNHDRTDPPWFDLFKHEGPGGIKLVGDRVLDIQFGEKILKLAGFDETPRERLKEQLHKLEPVDILLLHAQTQEFFRFAGERSTSLKEDLPENRFRLVVVGDIHVSKSINVGTTVCLSPGSIEIGDRLEAREKYFWKYELGQNGFVEHKLPLQVRACIDLRILEEDSMEEALREMEEADNAGAVVHLYYNPSVEGVVERVLAKRKNPRTYVAPEAMHETATGEPVDVEDAASVEELLPLESFVDGFTEDPVVAQAARVLLGREKANLDDVLQTLIDQTFEEAGATRVG